MTSKATNPKKALKECLKTLSNDQEANSKPSAQREVPKATTKEEYLERMAAKGEEEEDSPLEVSMSLLAKRKLDTEEGGLKANITVFSIFDKKEKKDYSVAALISGDMYSVKDQIKKCNMEECVVNNVTIPTVRDCMKAKFISQPCMDSFFRGVPSSRKQLAQYIVAKCKSGWLLYAPYRGEDPLRGSATVDLGVQLYHYALAWQRALTAQPLHFDKVEVVNYFIDSDELRVIDAMYATQDPHFGQRRGAVTINR